LACWLGGWLPWRHIDGSGVRRGRAHQKSVGKIYSKFSELGFQVKKDM
jgi:hypothetical protein